MIGSGDLEDLDQSQNPEEAAEGVRAVGETTEQALDRAGDALRRAGAFVHDTQEHVSEALRVGQETMRPPSTT